MRRRPLLWLAAIATLSLVVAVQVTSSAGDPDPSVARADVPTVAPGADVLDGVAIVPERIRGYDYRRAAFGDAWDDDNSAPGGHNGCDTRFLGGFDVLDKTRHEAQFTSGTLR